MVSIAQLDNEKQALLYQVDCLKDRLVEEEEISCEVKAEFKEKTKENSKLQKTIKGYEEEIKKLKEAIEFRDNFLAERGLSLYEDKEIKDESVDSNTASLRDALSLAVPDETSSEVFSHKMKRYWPKAFSLLLVSVVLTTAAEDQCQIGLLQRCSEEYQTELKSLSTEHFGGHCYRLQRMITCIAGESKCGGELIEKTRYWLLQMATMDTILGTCKDLDYDALKTVVQDTDVAKSHRYLDDVETDSFEECAVTVHKKCVRYYLTLLVKDHHICTDAEKLNKCYETYSKSINCNAKIIQHYAHMVEDVAHRVIELLMEHLNSLCTTKGEL